MESVVNEIHKLLPEDGPSLMGNNEDIRRVILCLQAIDAERVAIELTIANVLGDDFEKTIRSLDIIQKQAQEAKAVLMNAF